MRAHGARPAVETDGRVLSYAQLVEQAEATPADPILRAPNGPDWLVQALSCWFAEQCLMPLTPEREPLPLPSGQYGAGDFAALATRSSGSTGEPKQTTHPMSRLLRLAEDLIERLDLGPDDRSLWCISGASPFAITSQILPCLLAGGCLVVHQGFHPEQVSQALLQQGITRTYLFPVQYQALLNYPGHGHRLRSCVTGTELCSPKLHQAFEEHYGIGIHQSMGMSETLAYSLNTSSRPDKKGSVGQPIGQARVRIREGQIEVWRPDLDWYPTGDAGFIDDDGFLWFLGRSSLCGPDPLRWREQLNEILSWPEVSEAALLGRTAFLVIPDPSTRAELESRLAQMQLQAHYLDKLPYRLEGKTHYPSLLEIQARLPSAKPQP